MLTEKQSMFLVLKAWAKRNEDLQRLTLPRIKKPNGGTRKITEAFAMPKELL
jgi:hypothetical protein